MPPTQRSSTTMLTCEARRAGRRAAAVFYIVNVLLFPITLIGYVIWLTRIYMVRRAEGASITAQGPLSARWTMHRLGLRRDDAAYRLLMALPSTSGPALLLTAGPMLLAHRLSTLARARARADHRRLSPRGHI